MLADLYSNSPRVLLPVFAVSWWSLLGLRLEAARRGVHAQADLRKPDPKLAGPNGQIPQEVSELPGQAPRDRAHGQLVSRQYPVTQVTLREAAVGETATESVSPRNGTGRNKPCPRAGAAGGTITATVRTRSRRRQSDQLGATERAVRMNSWKRRGWGVRQGGLSPQPRGPSVSVDLSRETHSEES